MKIPYAGLKIMKAIAALGEKVSDGEIVKATGLPLSSVRRQLHYYSGQRIVTIHGQRLRRRLRITDKGREWIADRVEMVRVHRLIGRTISKPKPESTDARKRKCLGPDCGEMFMSEWNGERICKGCKAQLSWRGSQGEDYMVRHG